MIPAEVRLYTWLDVEDTLLRSLPSGAWPQWFVGARAYWDGVLIRVRPGSAERAKEWLRDVFDPRIVRADGDLFSDLFIALEAVDGRQRTLPVTIEETTERPPELRLTPSLSRPALVQPGITDALKPAPFPEDSPAVFAFHSFKGGVGRTVHALALARRIADERGPVLLVDADLEAPGITWLLESRLPSPPVSFADLLALVHGDPDPFARESIELVAARLQGASLDNLYVLPAFRSPRAFQTLEVRPEHLIQGKDDPFLLSTVLVDLGRCLAVQAIVVDLRAGLSELAAGLLLDPRIHRVFLTTLSGQSLSGTEVVLDLVARRAPSASEDHPVPVVIVNQVPTEGGETLNSAEKRLLGAVSSTVGQDIDVLADDVLRGPSWFDRNLLALSPDWDAALAVIQRSEIHATVQPLAQSVPPPAPQTLLEASELGAQRRELSNTASQLIYAEKGEGEDFLPILPLRRLVTDHRNQLPVAVVVGAKGAGKTYTYLQIVRRARWQSFVHAAGEARSNIDALLCPILQPKNISGVVPGSLRDARESTAIGLGLTGALDFSAIQDAVLDWLRENLHEGQWREHWLDLIAWTVGLRVKETGAGRALADHLAQRREHLLLLLDGLEDLFQDIASSEAEQRSLRALLQDVPNWLDQQPERFIGILVFVRRDMVAAAVRQNAAQLLARYEPYALKWDRVEALRLVAWVASKAGVIPALTVESIRQLNEEQLTEKLYQLWGRKLGSDKSREGRSAEWVIAALSDFRGQIQARDIVRFLHLAAQKSIDDRQWPDRLLAPAAIKKAVRDCSVEKIREISQESPALGQIFEKLRTLPAEKKSVPFKSEDVGLDPHELQLLELNGIAVAQESEYYMAEIFRLGLDFRLPFGARPKVLALARRRQGSAT